MIHATRDRAFEIGKQKLTIYKSRFACMYIAIRFTLRRSMLHLRAYSIDRTAKLDSQFGWVLSCALSVSMNPRSEGLKIQE